MDIQHCSTCTKPYGVQPETSSDKTGQCPHCSAFIYLASGEGAGEQQTPPAAIMPVAAPAQQKEYKVMSQKDKWFNGKFDPERLEQALNAYAREGWRVITCSSADIRTFMSGDRQELIIILERDV